MMHALLNALFWVYAISGACWALSPLATHGEQIGWAFYRVHMRRAERKAIRRELLRTELATAMAHYQQAQIDMATSLHAHAHTMAGLTGQPYLVTQSRGLYQVVVPEMIVPLATMRHYDINVPELTDDPRHNPWVLPPS